MFALNQDFGRLLNDKIRSVGASNVPSWPSFNPTANIKTRETWYAERITRAFGEALDKLGHTASLVSLTSESLQQRAYLFPGELKKGDINFYIGSRDDGLNGFVVGLFRSHNDTNGSRLIDNQNQVHQDPMLNSLRKLAHFCRQSKTSYGFIYTNDELIACRFRQRVYIRPIPLNGHGSMSPQQAMWYLCMLAFYDRHGLARSA